VTPAHQRNIVKWGEYLGYPKCCVDGFVAIWEDVIINRVKAPVRKLAGTGYIPCTVCNELSEEELTRTIEKGRVCPIPFPDLFYE
jgi:hypothetical protein